MRLDYSIRREEDKAKAGAEDTVRVHKLEDISKAGRDILLLSEHMPNQLIKGAWVVCGLGERAGKIPLSGQSRIESPVFSTPAGRKFSMWIDVRSRAVTKHDCYGLYFKYLPPFEKGEKLDFTVYVKNKRKYTSQQKYLVYLSRYKDFDPLEDEWGNAKFLKRSQGKTEDPLVVQFKIQPPAIDLALYAQPGSSRKTVGYVGLVNQGTTCYVNSMLQSLFTICEFRRAIFSINTLDSEVHTVPYALQRVFYNLQCSDEPVSTVELLYSFGWKKEDLVVQHDIQEFKCFLGDALDKIDVKLRGTLYQDVFHKLFVGRMVNFIKCKDIELTREREETFSDIQLNVKGCHNIYESFAQYIDCEDLVGDNRYMTEHNGLQRAEKGLHFKYLPPVLQLHLKRFEYANIHMLKINSEYSFPLRLELNPYVDSDKNAPPINYTYRLHSVVVHRGKPTSGHYFAHIYDAQKSSWLKFNDSQVSLSTEDEAVRNNYGGQYKTVILNNEGTHIFEKTKSNCSSAYMLIYIREAEYDRIQRRVEDGEIPQILVSRFRREKTLMDRYVQHVKRAKDSLFINVVSPEMIQGWSGPSISPGLLDTKEGKGLKCNPKYRVRMPLGLDITLKEHMAMFAQDAGLEPENIVVYRFDIEKYWHSLRRVTEADMKKTLRDAQSRSNSWGLFILNTSTEKPQPLFVPRGEDEQRQQKAELDELADFLNATKRGACIVDLDNDVPEWKPYHPEVAREDSSDAKTDIIDNNNAGAHEQAGRLVVFKRFDTSKGLSLLKAMMLKPEDKILPSAEKLFGEGKWALFQEQQMNTVLLSGFGQCARALRDDISARDLDDGAVVICTEKSDEAEKRITNYMKTWTACTPTPGA